MNALIDNTAANDPITEFEPFALRPRYECNSKGVFWIGIKTSKDGEVTEQEPIHLASKVEVIGNGEDNAGNSCIIIRYLHESTHTTRIAVLSKGKVVKGDCFEQLGNLGIDVFPTKLIRDKFINYLLKCGSKTPYIITAQAGWIANNHAYVLPNGEVITASNSADTLRIIYNGDKSQAHAYTPAGTLEEWQQHIASKVHNNSRLSLLLGTSLAAPLLPLLSMEAGGFHLFGDSKDGKTASAFVAASVWGKPEQIKVSWNGTSLAFQNIANASNHNLVYLDEIGEADAKQVAKTAYSITNGVSKAQGAKDGGNRDIHRWKILVLSTGEKPMDSYVKDGGEKWNAGQAARLPSIPSYAGKSIGSYDTLHGMNTSNELSQFFYANTAHYHGTAGRALIRLLLDQPNVISEVRTLMDNFIRLLPNMDGQAHVVALRFALVAATLELAARYGITGLPTGNAFTTIKQCFDDWLERNGSGKYEDKQILEQAMAFMQLHAKGMRFIDWNDKIGTTNHDHAGYYKRKDKAELDEWWIIPIVFEQEICKTFDTAKVCTVLHGIDWLQRPNSEKGWKQRKYGQGRFYVLVGMLPPDTSEQ